MFEYLFRLDFYLLSYVKQEKEVRSGVELWVILTLEDVHGRHVHGRHWTMSRDNVHSFMKICWKNCMDNVQCQWDPWTLLTHSMDSLNDVHDVHGIHGCFTDGQCQCNR